MVKLTAVFFSLYATVVVGHLQGGGRVQGPRSERNLEIEQGILPCSEDGPVVQQVNELAPKDEPLEPGVWYVRFNEIHTFTCCVFNSYLHFSYTMFSTRLISSLRYDWFTTVAGTSSIAFPAPSGPGAPVFFGAGLLTTTDDDQDRANAGIFLGQKVDDFFNEDLELGYWFYKADPGTVVPQNLNAAASLKIEVFNPCCEADTCIDGTTDCFGTLIYEPYLNGFDNEPKTNEWTEVTNAQDGNWWWSGGFGQASSAGGCDPVTNCFSLVEWKTEMPKDVDFNEATVVSLQIGVGSFNKGQAAYFDRVSIKNPTATCALNVVYNFESAATCPCEKPSKSEKTSKARRV